VTDLGKAFVAGLGKPSPATKNAIRLPNRADNALWKLIAPELKAGWFLDRFVYLFGPGLEKLERCLKAWSFLVPPKSDRIILGCNVHGAIVVMDDSKADQPSIHVLEPYVVTFWTHRHLGLESFLATWLPKRRIPYFLDDAVYSAWRTLTGEYLSDDAILAPKVPRDLGGERNLENFQVENIYEYYETTATAYTKHAGKRV
jgi:hypothetical protein